MKRITRTQDIARKAVVELRRLRGEVVPMLTVGTRPELDTRKARVENRVTGVWDYTACKSCGYLNCDCSVYAAPPVLSASRISELTACPLLKESFYSDESHRSTRNLFGQPITRDQLNGTQPEDPWPMGMHSISKRILEANYLQSLILKKLSREDT